MKSPLVPLFCQCALSKARELGSGQRADLLELAASMLTENDQSDLGDAANTLAKDLRNSEASQLRFDALLHAATNVNIVHVN